MGLPGSNDATTEAALTPFPQRAAAGVSGQGGSGGDGGGGGGGGGASDYEPLGAFLVGRASRGGTTITLSFGHVEQLLGRVLPASAHRHRQWWGNDPGHSQARAWLEAGWHAGPVDVTGGWVTFTRVPGESV
jgi:hypothetical protein